MELFTIIFLILGFIFILLEIILPGAISFCIGLGLLSLAFIYHNNIIRNPLDLFFVWVLITFLSSIIAVIITRKFFSGSTKKDEFIDTLDIVGDSAIVVEKINSIKGRILYQGTWWNAISENEVILKDQKVSVIKRIGNKFIVKSLN